MPGRRDSDSRLCRQLRPFVGAGPHQGHSPAPFVALDLELPGVRVATFLATRQRSVAFGWTLAESGDVGSARPLKSQKAPGKSYRKAISLVELMDMLSTEDTDREWFEQVRWPKGPICPYCGTDNVQSRIKHKTMTHRCRVCVKGSSKRMFSLKAGTGMEGSKLGYRT